VQARLLIVDDDPLLVKLNKRQLERFGYRVDAVTESNRALQMLASDPEGYQLLITDLAMPDLSGRQLIARLRGIAPKLPVIVCTGMVDPGIEAELSELGVRAIVEKPMMGNELVEAVQETLGVHR
jgi:CheY-like chemotaxis protein